MRIFDIHNGNYFYMSGGTIKNCTANNGSGVSLGGGGTFDMVGGQITSNTGGGVYSWGTINMSGGSITYNSGTGIYMAAGIIKISGSATISNNTSGCAGGIYQNGGTITMTGGSIVNNTSTGNAGAVQIWTGTFNFNGGKISGNTANTSSGKGGAFILWTDTAKLKVNGGYIGKNNAYTGRGVRREAGTVTYTSGRLSTASTYTPSGIKPSGSSYITFNQNNGTGGASSFTQSWNGELPTVNVPSRTGYTFNGYTNSNGEWYYNADGTPYNKTDDGIKWDYIGAQTLTANWTANKYTVTLDSNGGTGGTTSVTATYDAAMPTATMPTKTGYTFNGYFDAQTGGTKYYNADGSSARTWNKANNATLYAQWTANKYTVTLNNNGGTGGTTSVTATYDAAMPSATMPTKTGYTFNGYFDAQTGGTQYYNADGTSAEAWNKASTATLYAQWSEHTATLTYDANGHGTVPAAVTMTYTAATTAAAALTAENCVFLGWNTNQDGTGTTYKPDEIIKAANVEPADTTLYAQWNKKVDVPTVKGDKDNMFLYTGKEIKALEDTDAYTVTNGSATKSGKYTATLTLKSGYVWSDGTTDAKTVEWYIVNTEYYLVTAPTIVDGNGKVGNGLYNQRAYYMDENDKVTVKDELLGENKSIDFAGWYLRTMVQYKEVDGGTEVRFISMLNGECLENKKLTDYEYAGFKVTVGNNDHITLTTNEGYTSFLANENNVNIEDYSKNPNGTDFFFLESTKFENDSDITVTPFVKLMNGNTIEGAEVTFKFGDLN